MSIPIKLVEDILHKSLDEFFTREVDSILTTVNERNNCGRLAIYLEHHTKNAGLSEYYADPEYNRKQGGKVKTILGGDMKIITVNCDLILHSRGVSISQDNLIAIEMKKSKRPEREKNNDRDRLRAMTKSSYDDIWSNDGNTHPEHVCGYMLGVYIELDVATRVAKLEYYKGGNCASAASRNF